MIMVLITLFTIIAIFSMVTMIFKYWSSWDASRHVDLCPSWWGFEYLYLLKADYEKLPPGSVEVRHRGQSFASGWNCHIL
jgi:hypothetical protein